MFLKQTNFYIYGTLLLVFALLTEKVNLKKSIYKSQPQCVVKEVNHADNSVTGISSLIGAIHTGRQQKRRQERSKFHQTLRTHTLSFLLLQVLILFYILFENFFPLFSNYMYRTISEKISLAHKKLKKYILFGKFHLLLNILTEKIGL